KLRHECAEALLPSSATAKCDNRSAELWASVRLPTRECASRPNFHRREAAIAVWKIGVQVDGPTKERFGQFVVTRGGLAKMPQLSLVGGPSIKTPGRLA